MKRVSLLLAFVALLLIAALPKEELGEIRDQHPLDGSWICVKGPAHAGITWHFLAGKLKIKKDGQAFQSYQYKIDLSRSPHVIRFSDSMHGIFVIAGDSLTICETSMSFALPADFTERPGVRYYAFKRKPR